MFPSRQLISWWKIRSISCRVSLRGKVLASALSAVSHVPASSLPREDRRVIQLPQNYIRSSMAPCMRQAPVEEEGRKERWCRTDGIVFEHAQRLMRTWSLHCPVVARHGHRDKAHHNGAGLCCEVSSSAHARSDVSRRRAHCGSAGALCWLLRA